MKTTSKQSDVTKFPALGPDSRQFLGEEFETLEAKKKHSRFYFDVLGSRFIFSTIKIHRIAKNFVRVHVLVNNWRSKDLPLQGRKKLFAFPHSIMASKPSYSP